MWKEEEKKDSPKKDDDKKKPFSLKKGRFGSENKLKLRDESRNDISDVQENLQEKRFKEEARER